jgi:sugar phosphate isomerase/epimerase
LLETEIDTCWVNVAGVNPVEYLKQYTGRAPVVHLKDFVMEGKEKPAHLYELIGVPTDENNKPGQGEGSFAFRPVGYGVQNVPAIVQAAVEAGAQWLVVEQDKPGLDKTPLESAEMSIKYLKALK